MLRNAIAVIGVISLLLAHRVSSAGAIYSYRGENFDTIKDEVVPAGTYDTGMRIEGSVELVAPLAPNLDKESVDDSVLNFSFSDGRQTIDTGELGAGRELQLQYGWIRKHLRMADLLATHAPPRESG